MELHRFGFDERFRDAFQSYAEAGLTLGRVILQYNHIYTVATEDGEMHAQCEGKLRHVGLGGTVGGGTATPPQLSMTGHWVAEATRGRGKH